MAVTLIVYLSYTARDNIHFIQSILSYKYIRCVLQHHELIFLLKFVSRIPISQSTFNLLEAKYIGIGYLLGLKEIIL